MPNLVEPQDMSVRQLTRGGGGGDCLGSWPTPVQFGGHAAPNLTSEPEGGVRGRVSPLFKARPPPRGGGGGSSVRPLQGRTVCTGPTWGPKTNTKKRKRRFWNQRVEGVRKVVMHPPFSME